MTRHSFGFGRFLFGLIFCAIAALWLARDHITLSATQLVVAVPVTLIVLGMAGIIATLRKVNHDQAIDA